MSEFFASIKAFIEKVNLIVLLLSIALAILIYKIWLPDVVWAVFVFCLSYPCIAGIHKLIAHQYGKHQAKQNYKRTKAEKEKQKQDEHAVRIAQLNTIYESLSAEAQKGLIMLYRLPIPKGGLTISRIVDDDSEEGRVIWRAMTQAITIIIGGNALIHRDNILNKIFYIDDDFYQVLEEKSKTTTL